MDLEVQDYEKSNAEMSYTRKEKVKMNRLPDAIIIDKTGNDMSGQPTICTRELIGIIFAGMSPDEQYVPFSVAIDAENKRRCFGIISEDAYNRIYWCLLYICRIT